MEVVTLEGKTVTLDYKWIEWNGFGFVDKREEKADRMFWLYLYIFLFLLFLCTFTYIRSKEWRVLFYSYSYTYKRKQRKLSCVETGEG